MPYRLLLADDSLTIQKVVELVLANEDFEIKAVGDGEQAAAFVDSFDPHIVLADIEMPKLNGYQLCAKIKKNPVTAHIPVILLAGAFEPFDEEYAREVGAEDFIIKPFESQELISKIKALRAHLEAEQETTGIEVPEQEEVFELGEDLQDFAPASIEELKWDPEVAELTKEETVPEASMENEPEEEPGHVEELSSEQSNFDAVLTDAMNEEKLEEYKDQSEEVPGPAAPERTSAEEVAGMIKASIEEKVSAAMQNDILPHLTSIMKESVESRVSATAPEVISTVTRELFQELLPSLRDEITAAINRVVPEVAETIIRQEIEKITSEV